ncbi:MAG: hypothetical protein AAB578_07820, partial [Elusimicrobiota bacterium]
MPYRAPRRVLLIIALLGISPLVGHASFYEQKSGQFLTIEKEVSYRPGTEQMADWQAVLASKDG